MLDMVRATFTRIWAWAVDCISMMVACLLVPNLVDVLCIIHGNETRVLDSILSDVMCVHS